MKKIDHIYLFKGTKIESYPEIMKKQGLYPIIYFTFKDEKHSNFDKFIDNMRIKISSVYKMFYYIYDKLEFEDDKVYFMNIINRKSSIAELEASLMKLSEYLNRYHNHKVIILIDEYDTPIYEGYFNNYYKEAISCICIRVISIIGGYI